jgi:prepilin-type processing-associated H-X9-DG protein
VGGTAPSEQATAQSLAAIPATAQTVLVSESKNCCAEVRFHDTPPSSPTRCSVYRPLGTVNFLFADGHVKAMKPLATGTPVNMWTCEEDGAAPDACSNACRTGRRWSKNLRLDLTPYV